MESTTRIDITDQRAGSLQGPVFRIIDSDELVRALADRLRDPARETTVLVVSRDQHTGRLRVEQDRLCAALGQDAEVYILDDSRISWLLTELGPRNCHAYNGAVRVVLPATQDPDLRNSSVKVPGRGESPASFQRKILERLRAVAPPGVLAPSATTLVDEVAAAGLTALRDQLLVERGEVPAPQAPATVVPRPVPAPAASRPVTKATETASVIEPVPGHSTTSSGQVPDEETLVAAVASEVVRQLSPHLEAVGRAVAEASDAVVEKVTDMVLDVLTQPASDHVPHQAETEVGDGPAPAVCPRDHETRDVVDLDVRGGFPTVFDDPAEQLRWEVEQVWLRGFSPAERRELPLGAFAFGKDFLASTEQPIVPRGKMLEFMVDVVTGRVWRTRDVHAFREDEGSAASQLRRFDGALAWRGNLKVKSHGAPRIHWWQLPDGSVEFIHVGHHDDMI